MRDSGGRTGPRCRRGYAAACSTSSTRCRARPGGSLSGASSRTDLTFAICSSRTLPCFPHALNARSFSNQSGSIAATRTPPCLQHEDGTRHEWLDRMGRLDLQTYLLELLMKQDQMSMAASIESRVPFLDDHVVDYVAALPGHFKVRGWQTKAVLRSAVADLIPPAILTRPKMGFPVPFGRLAARRVFLDGR